MKYFVFYLDGNLGKVSDGFVDGNLGKVYDG
jgi:hypothetical protein